MYFIGVVYLFLGIAIICDDFFVSSLEAISEKLQLSEDVAGKARQPQTNCIWGNSYYDLWGVSARREIR